MRRIAVPLYALALAGGVALAVVFVSTLVFFVVRGENHQPRQAQASMPLPACPPPGTWSHECQRLEGPLAPRQQGYESESCNSGGCVGFPLPLEAARVSGDTVRYVVKSETPAMTLQSGMSTFLWNFRFGVRGRPMRVRLRDGHGRFAWSAGYDGVESMWVNARSDLKGCGPFALLPDNPAAQIANMTLREARVYIKGRMLPNASGAREAPPCPLEFLRR